MQLLGGLNRKEFLEQYWQKKPFLIRQALPDYQSPLSAEEFAGLACEDGVESRLIQEQGGEKPWQVRHGPFNESDFTSLPESHWTLLVQSVDHHVPELAVLLDEFDFIPAWRIDDLMVSFAQTQGSVGPHLDNYDVFLLQVQGKRHWHINENQYSNDDLMPNTDLKILKHFQSQQDWILEPGDMLYLPPEVAHYGIALDDCLTFSIGFRAPTRKELLIAYTDSHAENFSESFYRDPDLCLQDSPGEINKTNIKAIQNFMNLSNVDQDEFNHWFGCFITEKTNELEFENEALDEQAFLKQFKQSKKIMRNGNIRFSYIVNKESISLFVAGEEILLSSSYHDLVSYITANHCISLEESIQCCNESAVMDLFFKLYDNHFVFLNE